MLYPVIKAGAVFVALGGFALAVPALAVSPLPLDATAPPLLPVQDEENEEVWHDLRPDVTPPEAAVGKEEEASKGSSMKPPKGEGSGEVEQEELQEDVLEPE